MIRNLVLLAMVGATAACAAQAEDVFVCEPIRAPQPAFGGIEAAAMTTYLAEVGGRDLLELWVCKAGLCAPAFRVGDQGGLVFQWREDGVLDVATHSLAPERLTLPESLEGLVMDVHQIDGGSPERRTRIQDDLNGTGRVGGFGFGPCKPQDEVSWPGLGKAADRPAG